MAIVGDAYVVVRALTNRIDSDIRNGFKGVDRIGENEGKKIGDSFSRGLSSSGGNSSLFSKKFLNEAEQARQSFNKLVQTGYFLGPALAGVAGGVGALGATLVTLVSVLGAAAPSAIVFAGALSALAQAAGVAKLAFAGVSKAIGAGLKAQTSGAKNTKALESATRRLEDARRRLYRLEKEGKPELLADLAERQKNAEEALADAKISSSRAERTYRDAQEKTKKSLENLNKAREDAKEKIQQLRFEVEGGAISEKKARLEFEKARDSLQRVQDLPPNSRARQEAELAFAEADLNLRKAIDRNKDLKKEEKAATAAGVEGSEAVKDAKLAIRDATEAEADARIGSAQASIAVNKAAAEAEKAKNEALNDPNKSKAIRDFNRQIADARRDVKDAEKDLKEAQTGGSAADAYTDALKELSPEAQRFVKFIVGLKGEFNKLKAAAGKELFPKLETAIQNLVTNLFPKLGPLLQGTGSALGDVAIEISKAVTEAGNLKALESVWKTNDRFIRKLGKASGNLYGAFITLLKAAGPLIDKFGDWLVKVTETFEMTVKAKDATGELTDNFNKAGTVAARIGKILKNYFKGFIEIGKAVMNGGAGERLLKYFEDASKRFADLMKSMNEDGSLGKYFDKATENGLKVLDLLVNIVAELLKLGDDKGVGGFADSLSRAVDTFGKIGATLTGSGPAFGAFVEEFATLIKNLTESGSIEIFFNILTDVLKVLNKIFGNEVVQSVFKFLAPIFAATRAFGLMFKIAKFGFLAMAGNIAAPFKAIGAFKTNIGKAKDAFDTMRLKGMYAMDAIKKGWGNVARAAGSAKTAIGSALTTAGQGIKAGATKGFDVLKSGFSTLGTAAKTAAMAVGNALKQMVLAVGRALMAIGRALMANPWILIIIALVALVILIVKNWDKIKEVVGAAVEWIGEKVGAAWNWIKEKTSGVLSAVVTFFTELPGKLLNAIQSLATTVLEFIAKYHPLAIIWRLVSENWEKIKTWFTELPGKIKDAVVGLSTTVLEFINKYHPILVLWRLVTENWEKIKTWFTQLPGKIKDALVGLSTTVAEFIGKYHPIALLKKAVEAAWPAVSSFITTKIDSIVTFVKGLPSKIATAAAGMWNGITSAFKSAINFIIDGWNRIEFKIPGFKIGPVKFGGFTLGLPDIPRLAKGGIIPASPGGTLATIGEAGRPERVEPLDADGLSVRDKAIIDKLTMGATGTPVTVNVYPSAGMNERELANLVSKQLAYQLRKGAA